MGECYSRTLQRHPHIVIAHALRPSSSRKHPSLHPKPGTRTDESHSAVLVSHLSLSQHIFRQLELQDYDTKNQGSLGEKKKERKERNIQPPSFCGAVVPRSIPPIHQPGLGVRIQCPFKLKTTTLSPGTTSTITSSDQHPRTLLPALCRPQHPSSDLRPKPPPPPPPPPTLPHNTHTATRPARYKYKQTPPQTPPNPKILQHPIDTHRIPPKSINHAQHLISLRLRPAAALSRRARRADPER